MDPSFFMSYIGSKRGKREQVSETFTSNYVSFEFDLGGQASAILVYGWSSYTAVESSKYVYVHWPDSDSSHSTCLHAQYLKNSQNKHTYNSSTQ